MVQLCPLNVFAVLWFERSRHTYMHIHTYIHKHIIMMMHGLISFFEFVCLQFYGSKEVYSRPDLEVLRCKCTQTCIHTFMLSLPRRALHACIHTYIHTSDACSLPRLEIHSSYIHTLIHTYIHTSNACSLPRLETHSSYMHTLIHAYIHTYKQAMHAACRGWRRILH